MSNPFEPYLPCYPPGTVAERPWWRRDGGFTTFFTRSDGLTVTSDNPNARMEWVARAGSDRRSEVLDRVDWPTEPADTWAVLWAFMDRVDAAHPLPVPPVLLGQVWWTGGRYVFGLPGEGRGRNWCLVYGPLAPYAPPGWRP